MPFPTEEEVLGAATGRTYDDSLPPFKDPLAEVLEPAAKDDVVVEIVDDAPAAEKPAVAAKPPVEDELAPLPDDPPGVQKRINKLTARNHAERRDRLKAEHERDSLFQYNAQLRQRVEMAERAAIGQQGHAVQSQKAAIDAQLAQARSAIKQGYDSGDTERVIQGQEILASLVSRKNDIDKYTQPVYNGPSVPEYVPATAKPQGEDAPCSESVIWHASNPWYGVDEARTAFANELDGKLKAAGDLDPTSPKYFEAIDRAVRARFPVSVPDGDDSTSGERPNALSATPVRRGGPVAPATRTNTTQPNSVRLTQDEAIAAEKTRPATISREAWLKHYAITKTKMNADGSYTHES